MRKLADVTDPRVHELLHELVHLVADDGPVEELVAFLSDLTPAQRAGLSAPVAQLAEKQLSTRDEVRRPAVALAVLGCGGGVRQVADGLGLAPVHPGHESAAAQVLADRAPHWLADLPAALLRRRSAYAPNHVRLIRALVRRGLVQAPRSAEYAQELATGLNDYSPPGLPRAVLEALRTDPGILDADLWHLLSTETAGRLLAKHDRYRVKLPGGEEQSWQHALLVLTAGGAIERNRLLDTVLDVLITDWAPADQAFALHLHDRLAPTVTETAARQGRYIRLLTAGHGPIVKLALRHLTALLEVGQLDLESLLGAAAAPLHRTDKATATATLNLLAAVARTHPGCAEQLADIIGTALRHPVVDIQERARALLAELVPGTGQDGARRDEHFSAEATMDEAPGVPAVTPPTPEAVEIEPVIPLASADELADLLNRLLAAAEDAIAVERALDGLVRFAGQRPRHGIGVLNGSRSYPSFSLRDGLGALASGWLRNWQPILDTKPRGKTSAQLTGRVAEGKEPAADIDLPSLRELTTHRLQEVARLVHAGGAPGLMSLPTAGDGSLQARELIRRVALIDPGTPPAPIDAVIALLRVPPAQHHELRFPAGHAVGEYLTDQLRALRQYRPQWQPVLWSTETDGPPPNVWPAEAARTPPFGWQDRAPAPCGLSDPLAAVLNRAAPLQNHGDDAGIDWSTREFETTIALWSVMLPHHPDLLAAHSHPRLLTGLHVDRSENAGTAPLFDALATTRQPLGEPALAALALGISALDRGERTRAVDAVIELGDRGALDGTAFGRVVAQLLRQDIVVGNRLVNALADAAESSVRTADAILDSLIAVLDAVADRRDAHLFVDLLAQLATRRGRSVRLPDAFTKALAARTALGRACRRVPTP